MSFAEVLAKAGMARDAFRPDRPLRTARRIETLEALARACEWTLAEVCGFDVLNRINPKWAKDAYEQTEQALEQVLSPEQQKAVIWEVYARVYELVVARNRDGLETTERDWALIRGMIAREFRDRPPTVSSAAETPALPRVRTTKPDPV